MRLRFGLSATGFLTCSLAGPVSGPHFFDKP